MSRLRTHWRALARAWREGEYAAVAANAERDSAAWKKIRVAAAAFEDHMHWLGQKAVLKQDAVLLGSGAALRRALALSHATSSSRSAAEYLTVTADTAEADLKQRREIVLSPTGSPQLAFSDSAVVRAARNGSVLILDGLERAERNVLPTLNNLLENREMDLADGSRLVSSSQNKGDGRDVLTSDAFRVVAISESRRLDPPLRSRLQGRFVRAEELALLPTDLSRAVADVAPDALCAVADFANTYRALSAAHSLEGMARYIDLHAVNATLEAYVLDEVSLREALRPSVEPFGVGGTGGSAPFAAAVARELASIPDTKITGAARDRILETLQNSADTSPFLHDSTASSLTSAQMRVAQRALREAHRGHPVCVIGPSGSGKSTVAVAVARALAGDRQVARVASYRDLSARDLLQRRSIASSGATTWRDAVLVSALRGGAPCVVEDAHLLAPGVADALSMLAADHEVVLPSGEWIAAPPDAPFHLLATATTPLRAEPLPHARVFTLPELDAHELASRADGIDGAVLDAALAVPGVAPRAALRIAALANHGAARRFLPAMAQDATLAAFDPSPEPLQRVAEAVERLQGLSSAQGHELPALDIARANTPAPDADRLSRVPAVSFVDSPWSSEILERLAAEWNAVLLIGSQGVGKNMLVDRFLELLRLPRHYTQLHRDTTVHTLTARSDPLAQNGDASDPALLRAARYREALVVDEADKCAPDALALLRAIVADGSATLPGGETVRADFPIFFLANRPGYPFHGNALYGGLTDALSVHVIDNPPIESEVQILAEIAPSLSREVPLRLARAFALLRDAAARGETAHPFSLREAVHCVRHLEAFPEDGLERALHNVFAADVESREAIRVAERCFAAAGLVVDLGGAEPLALPDRISARAWALDYAESSSGMSRSVKECGDLGVAEGPVSARRIRLGPPQREAVPLWRPSGAAGALESVFGEALPPPHSARFVSLPQGLGAFHSPRGDFVLYSNTMERLRWSLAGDIGAALAMSPSVVAAGASVAAFVPSAQAVVTITPEESEAVCWVYRLPRSVSAPRGAVSVVGSPHSDDVWLLTPASATRFDPKTKRAATVTLPEAPAASKFEDAVAGQSSLWKLDDLGCATGLPDAFRRTRFSGVWNEANDARNGFSLSLQDSHISPLAVVLEDGVMLVRGVSGTDYIVDIGKGQLEKVQSAIEGDTSNVLARESRSGWLGEVSACSELGDGRGSTSASTAVEQGGARVCSAREGLEGWRGRFAAPDAAVVGKMCDEGEETAVVRVLMSAGSSHGVAEIPLTALAREGCALDGSLQALPLHSGRVALAASNGVVAELRVHRDHVERAQRDRDLVSHSPKEKKGPKEGRHDPDNRPHVGGNTWAGGTGGSDTAGLGGRGGPYRLDKGHRVHQVREDLKQESATERQRRAAMAREALAERLAAVDGLSSEESRARYTELMQAIEPHVARMKQVLEAARLRTDERRWQRYRTEGELDPERIVDGVSGDRNVYMRRERAEERVAARLGSTENRHRVHIVADASGSMYRFNGEDGRLDREEQALLMVMEAVSGFSDRYAVSLAAHSGEDPHLDLFSAEKFPSTALERLQVLERVRAHAQYCMSGDCTLEGLREAIGTASAGDFASRHAILLSDANMARYGLGPADFQQVLQGGAGTVNAHVVFIASFGDEAHGLARSLGSRAHFCPTPSDIPAVLRAILEHTVDGR